MARKRHKEIYLSGSYTIEAALIFPIVLYIMVALIYLGFYLHDLGKLQAIIHESLIKGKSFVRNEVNIETGQIDYEEYLGRTIFYPLDNSFDRKEKELENYIYRRLYNAFFLGKVNDVKVGVSSTRINVEVILQMDFPIVPVRKFFTRSSDIKFSLDTNVHNPMSFIRGFEVAANIGKRIEKVDEILKQIKNILGILK